MYVCVCVCLCLWERERERENTNEITNERLGCFPFMILLMGSVPGYLKLLQNGLQAPPLWPLPLSDVILGKGMRASLWFPPKHLWGLRMACLKNAECRAGRAGSSCRGTSQMWSVICQALLTELVPRRPRGPRLDWGPRCASCRQYRT